MSKQSTDADVKFIQALAELLNVNELTELSVKRNFGVDDSLDIRVVKQANIVTSSIIATQPAPVGVAVTPAATEGTSSDPAQHPGAVTSPMVGTAYLSAELDSRKAKRTMCSLRSRQPLWWADSSGGA